MTNVNKDKRVPSAPPPGGGGLEKAIGWQPPAGGGQLVVSDNQLSTSEVQLCSVSTGKVNCKYQSNEGKKN